MRRVLLALLLGSASGFLLGGLHLLSTAWLAGELAALRDRIWGLAFIGGAVGVPLGAVTGVVALAIFLSAMPTGVVLRQLPFLFGCGLLGLVPGVFHSLAPALTAPALLLAGAGWLRAGWNRSSTNV